MILRVKGWSGNYSDKKINGNRKKVLPLVPLAAS